jgi:hypothetical protein
MNRSAAPKTCERAFFTARRKTAWEALHPETIHGGDRKHCAQSSRQLGDLNDEAPKSPTWRLRKDPSSARSFPRIAPWTVSGCNASHAVFRRAVTSRKMSDHGANPRAFSNRYRACVNSLTGNVRVKITSRPYQGNVKAALRSH